jgi:hypothetical protein
VRSYKLFFFCLIPLSIALGTTGCSMHRAPGAMLPSLAAVSHDRSIEKHAAKSGFPSPSDVGFGEEETETR